MGISIILPVGPQPAYRKYLGEAVYSIAEQCTAEDEIVVVDDMAGLSVSDIFSYIPDSLEPSPNIYLYKNSWVLGCSNSWNIGVSEARNNWCILMGSDDKLLPGCLDACRDIINDKHDPLGYYNLACETSSGEFIGAHNNAAMVSRALWKETGGFPLSGTIGAPDALLISIMMVHMSEHLHQVDGSKAYYWVREHEDQDTRRMGAFFSSEVLSIRNKETERWTKPDWT